MCHRATHRWASPNSGMRENIPLLPNVSRLLLDDIAQPARVDDVIAIAPVLDGRDGELRIFAAVHYRAQGLARNYRGCHELHECRRQTARWSPYVVSRRKLLLATRFDVMFG
jgi:hypothetical protein